MVADRVAGALQRAAAAVGEQVADRDGLAVVVSHGAALRLGMSRLLGMPDDLIGVLGPLSNCSWSVLGHRRGRWRLLEHNAGTLPEPVLSATTARDTFMPNDPGHSVSVTWYGQSGFRLAAGDSRVLIDPFLTERADRNYQPPATAADFADITLVLCTHEHVDHLDLPFLREFCAVNSHRPDRASRCRWPRSPPRAASTAARLTGAVPGEDLHDRDVSRAPGPALHGMGGDEPVAYEFAPDGGPVRFLGYVLEIGGIRFYHAGDGLVYPELPATLSALAPDVLMLPINGRDHMREVRAASSAT